MRNDITIDSKTDIILGRVKEIRIRPDIHLTQEKFAEQIDVSTNTISRIERGEISLTSGIAIKIARKWRVSLDYLFGLSPCMASELSDEELTNAQNIIEMQAATIKELREKLDAIQRILEGKKPIIKLEKPYHSD